MKKRILFFLFSLFFILFVKNNLIADDTIISTQNDTVIITGKIIITDDSSVCLVSKWNTRSKITYLIAGDNSEEFKKLQGKVIEAICLISEKKAWSGTIKILKYKNIHSQKNYKPKTKTKPHQPKGE